MADVNVARVQVKPSAMREVMVEVPTVTIVHKELYSLPSLTLFLYVQVVHTQYTSTPYLLHYVGSKNRYFTHTV